MSVTSGSLFVPNCRHGRVIDSPGQVTRRMVAAQDGLYACRLLYFAAVQNETLRGQRERVNMTPDKQPDILAWAKNEAGRLRRVSEQSEITDHFGYSDDARPLAAAALDILRRHASGTAFLGAAEGVFHTRSGPGGDQALRRVADVLESWVQFVEEGLEAMPPFPVRARMEAATDLMEQVQQLLDDSSAHPAGAVVLAGAALEEFLRSQVSASNATVNGRPGISAYASALRSSGYFSAQDVKDVTAWAGQRNEAAHGQFERLSRDRAQIMVDGINLFIRQKTDGISQYEPSDP